MRKRSIVILFSLFVVVSLIHAASYTLTQIKPGTVASYMAANDTFFVKSDWIGGCGGADPVYLSLKKVIGDRSGIPFAVANWGDWKVFRALDANNPGLNYFLRIGGKTHAWRGPRVFWSVYEWAYGILSAHNRTAGLPVQPPLRTAPDSGGSNDPGEGLTTLYSFDNGSAGNAVSGGYDFSTLGWSRYLRDNTLDIYHGYMSEEGVTRPKNFTSGLGFRNNDLDYRKGFSVSMEFKPRKQKKELRHIFGVGGVPRVALARFNGAYYLAIDTRANEYGVVLPDLKIRMEAWNTIAFSFDPQAGRVRIRLNGARLRDIALPAGISGNNVGEEAHALKKKYAEKYFSFVYGRAGNIFSGQVDNLAFWSRPLSGAEINQAVEWVRARTGSGSAPVGRGTGSSTDSGLVPPGE